MKRENEIRERIHDATARIRADLDYATQDRDYWADCIKQLAYDHQPKLRIVNTDSLPGVDMRSWVWPREESWNQSRGVEFSCAAKNCPYSWPCPTYLWATGSKPFKLVVEPKDEP